MKDFGDLLSTWMVFICVIEKRTWKYPSYALDKAVINPLPLRNIAKRVAKTPLQRVYTDLAGPIRTLALGGSNFSSHVWKNKVDIVGFV